MAGNLMMQRRLSSELERWKRKVLISLILAENLQDLAIVL